MEIAWASTRVHRRLRRGHALGIGGISRDRAGPAQASTWKIGCLAMAFSVVIELSQLYHAPWIDSIRHTTLGGLILGFGFLWSDLACYAVGVGLGAAIETFGLELADRRNLPNALVLRPKVS